MIADMTDKVFNTVPVEDQIDAFFQGLATQAQRPPGGDLSIGACYAALLTMRQEPELARLLTNTFLKRVITPSHLMNLLFRAIQFSQMQSNDLRYSAFKDQAEWIPILRALFYGKAHAEILKILIDHDTTTTLFQRYASLKAIANYLFINKSISVIDLGCGGNLGLPGLAGNIAFQKIEDHTPNRFINHHITKAVSLKSALAIDKYDPNEEKNVRWREACSFYPGELSQINERRRLEEKIKKYNNISFIQYDLGSNQPPPKRLPLGKTDIVFASTIFYQLSPSERQNALSLAYKLINKTGIILIQDFAVLDKHQTDGLRFHDDWGKFSSYRTFLLDKQLKRPQELLRWNNGRCASVKAGVDFDIFNKIAYTQL